MDNSKLAEYLLVWLVVMSLLALVRRVRLDSGFTGE
jgi:hypothetical protein